MSGRLSLRKIFVFKLARALEESRREGAEHHRRGEAEEEPFGIRFRVSPHGHRARPARVRRARARRVARALAA